MKNTIRLLAVAAALLASGCVYTAYRDPYGRQLTRISIFGNQEIGKVDLNKGTIEAYKSNQADVAAAVTGAAVAAAMQQRQAQAAVPDK